MNAAWELLSPSMQQVLHELGWDGLWPVQEAAIRAIRGGEGNVLIAGDTASGKTEAAYLPILSHLEEAGRTSGFFALGIAPLRALLNDQRDRLAILAAPIGAQVHLWHSDVTGARKARAQNAPGGILLTTPESLESMLLHRTLHLPRLFGGLRFVIVDELHAFLGTGRGIQLDSLLRRLRRYTEVEPRRVALSATLSDLAAARAFLGEPVAVCAGGGPAKPTRLHLRYAPDGVQADLRRVTAGRKALIFCNSRARVEALTFGLGRMAGTPDGYLAHHGSLHSRERARAEAALRDGPQACSIVCTSTMELGVDVGDCDLVVEVDCTGSVTGLRQRLGRSGRRPGRARTGQLYASTEAGLVQAVAVVELLREGWLEPPESVAARHDVTWHQLVAIAVERGSRPADRSGVPEALLDHMLRHGHLAPGHSGDLGLWLAGPVGARLAADRRFLGVFDDSEAWEVAAGPRLLGQLPPLPIYRPGASLILAGRIWTIVAREAARRRFEVRPGGSEQPPVFVPSPWRVHGRVRRAMADVLCGGATYPYLDQRGAAVLGELRPAWARIGLSAVERPITLAEDRTQWHAFAGDRAAATLALWLGAELGGAWASTVWGGVAAADHRADAPAWLAAAAAHPPSAAEMVSRAMAYLPDSALRLPKFGRHLPRQLQRELHAARELDGDGALEVLTGYGFPVVEEPEGG
ncbi:MAG TPA: DEAD/DEAH box helicase [Bacillota bacterium]|nr:DEAD/DEAH box helicase [Bacillota bacterium]